MGDQVLQRPELAGRMSELLQSSAGAVRVKTDRAFVVANEHADLQKEVLKIERIYASMPAELEGGAI